MTQNYRLVYRIQPGKQNIISRKDGDLLLLGDQSISRKHAQVIVLQENKCAGILLKDLGSKYGTFKACGGGEMTQISPNEPITLNNGDLIRFGIQWNVWSVEYFPLIVATSTLNADEKAEVQNFVESLSGEVAKDWQDSCTHLTMNKLTMTVKVVCALACGKPIVIPAYWKALNDALAAADASLPDYKDFVPPLVETLLNPSEVSFTPNPERAKLFKGYTFVATSARQLNRIKPMITAAGGNVVEFSAESWPQRKLMQARTVLMQLTTGRQGSQQSQVADGYMNAARQLKAEGVRCIPESEIGLSILYCSLDHHCNPRHNPQSLFGDSSQNTQQITTICANSEESTSSKASVDMTAPSSSKKRVLENSSDDDNPRKKANSEDLFSSQGDEHRTGQNPNVPSTSSNKQEPKDRPIVNPSLDMFAPSGQSDVNKNTLTKSKSNLSQNIPKANQIVNPSLDMFAPSGQSSVKTFPIQIPPSNHDIFAPSGSRQSSKKRNASNESTSTPNKQPRKNDDEENDDFSFSNKTSKTQKTSTVKDDAFSFASSKRSHQNVMDEDEDDAFSFVSSKKGNQSKSENKDEFSFISSKSSKKRNRSSNADMFDTSNINESNNRPSCSGMTNRNLASYENNEDDLFAFTEGQTLKKRKEDESVVNIDEPELEVKLGLFSKKENSTDVQDASEPIVFDPPDEKTAVVYSKDKSHNVKQEVCNDDEIDELSKELYNTTIVVVKPLVVAKQEPVVANAISSGKNFKKFRKVTGLNKRAIPHIIGGSDLVPHYANCENIDDVLPPSPPPVEPDDDWGFAMDKKKGRKR
ncbi:nibrin-like isoform X2 [Macrosteles quadrilineatus]|uniref:nibrin-like isoform X2 n=1 Tax=Macrosteles quadrilineatus TaxID=74068 RepID=UPI0023E14BFA|nr:nibrin-like isoform X2 [Macrosteles quadrilineatus]